MRLFVALLILTTSAVPVANTQDIPAAITIAEVESTPPPTPKATELADIRPTPSAIAQVGLKKIVPNKTAARELEKTFRRIESYRAIIERVRTDHKLKKGVVQAIIAVESAGDAQAQSPKGAKGLMQVMPMHFTSHEKPRALNPDLNIRKGVEVLADSLRIADGDMIAALALYNGSHAPVKRAMRRAENSPHLDTYTALPPARRSYVAKVEATRFAYGYWKLFRTVPTAKQFNGA